MSVLMALMLAQATPVAAAPAQALVADAAIDPARLVVARRVLETIFPAAQREQIMAAIVGGIDETIERSVLTAPQFEKMISEEPRAKAVFETFVQRQRVKSAQRMQAATPTMVEAMSRAYARRFTVAQLEELRAFFETPTGKVYVSQSATIMSDPDVSAWQGKMMADSLASIEPDVKIFLKELTALAPAGKAK